MNKSLPGVTVELSSKEVGLGTELGRLLASILDFEAWPDEVEGNLEVLVEEIGVNVESAPENVGSA